MKNLIINGKNYVPYEFNTYRVALAFLQYAYEVGNEAITLGTNDKFVIGVNFK